MDIENKILACVDQSQFADYVVDYAIWAAARLESPVELLHVVNRHSEVGSGDDHSGEIGIDAQENLLTKISAEDEVRTKVARERGRIFLDRLRNRALSAGLRSVDVRQRQGELAETIAEQESRVQLLILGRRGEVAESASGDLGKNVESVVRSWRKLALTVTEPFREPRRVMIAFDGGATTRRAVEFVAASPLFGGLEVSVVMAGRSTTDSMRQLDWARGALEAAGMQTAVAQMSGEPEVVIAEAIREQSVDLLVMGAYSHAPWQKLFSRSKTTDLLRSVRIPTLIVR